MARFGPDYASPIERLRREGVPLERDARRKRGEPPPHCYSLFAGRVIPEPMRRDTHVYGLVTDRNGDYQLVPSPEENMSLEISVGKVTLYERIRNEVYGEAGARSFLVAVEMKESGEYEFVPALLKLSAKQAEGVLSCGQMDFDVYTVRHTREGDSGIFAVRDFSELRRQAKEPGTRLFLGARVNDDFISLCWLGSVGPRREAGAQDGMVVGML